ncbi:putative pentatricopeptide repeat-containing protein At5g13230, mitochondrial [Silene latifolia]|uniref:putative pentatricopeptide repeat-containing protein At5g13230, mitochondrial n=1 Tax=Silene latifolia TaxID=37657 RepID=UPI003D76F117
MIKVVRQSVPPPVRWLRNPNPEFDSHVYTRAIQDCLSHRSPVYGQLLHSQIIKRGNCLDLFGRNTLLNFYVHFNLLSHAITLFRELSRPNTVSYVTLIHGYSRASRFPEALECFSDLHSQGHPLTPFVFTSFFKLLISMDLSHLGSILHASLFKLGHASHHFVATSLVDSYSCSGFVSSARSVFDSLFLPDLVSWTGMLTCYSENACFLDALSFFSQMLRAGFRPNQYTFTSVLKACVGLRDLNVGTATHAFVLKSCYDTDCYVAIALLDLYISFGRLGDAHQIFETMPKEGVISWSFMISRCAQSDQSHMALTLFRRMRQSIMPNEFTLASGLQACATLSHLDMGMLIHALVLKIGLTSNVFVSNALIDVYAKCARMQDSELLFEDSANKTDVTWNTMIVGYAQLGDGEKAIMVLRDMLKTKLLPTEVAYSSALRACATLAAVDPGTQIHAFAIKTKSDRDNVVGNSLVDMYGKCGNIKPARLVFDMMEDPDQVSWNSIISAYAVHGLAKEALSMFQRMQETQCKPNNVTFVAVLSACSNIGLLDEGEAYFDAMIRDYGIEPSVEHYTCMVGLLGRSGNLDKAMKLITEMPLEPTITVWRAMLGACAIHNNVDLGRVAAENILKIEPQNDAAYVLMSNIFASKKKWGDVAHVRKSMKNKGLKKEPGVSWVEIQGTAHYFTVGDTSHPDIRLIRGMLEWLRKRIKREGYIADCNAVLFEVEDDEKELHLWSHSERLALAFAIVRTPVGAPIRILKNLRICTDCHAAFKLISKVVQREIVVRDINRFHHLQDGICSCGDFW